MSRVLLPVLLLAGACHKAPAEAPKELGELGAFLFANLDAEDTAELQAGVLNLRDYLTTDVDWSAEAKDRAVTMPILKGDDLGGLSIPSGADANLQVPIALPGASPHSVAESMTTVLSKNQICIESDTTIWAERTFVTDKDCFEDGSCEFLEVTNEVRKENFLAKVWYDQFKTYRWVEVEDEDGEVFSALVSRSWLEEVFPADGGNNSWDQLFQLDVYIPDPDKKGSTLRWFSMWSSVTLGGVGDDFYADLVISGIDQAYIFADEFIDGDIQACKLDRDLAKPDR